MPVSCAPRDEVTPLEIWDRVVDGQTLFAWQSDASFGRRVVRAIADIDAPLVYIAGGRRDLAIIARHIRQSGRRCVVDPNGPFAGAAGVERLFGPQALGLDIGQTSVKVWWGERRARVVRDWSVLPLEAPSMSPEVRRAGEEAFVAMVDTALGAVRQSAPAAAVVAVPAAVDADCVMHGSSYPYASPNAHLLQRIADATRADDVIACNDAELVAHSAATLSGGEPTLALTFGWGVGAALFTPR